MKLSNDWYDALKFIATIFAPAFATLVGTIGMAVGYADVSGVLVTVITAFGAFIGSLIGLSSMNYNKEE